MKQLNLNLLSPEKRASFLNLARFLFIKEILEFIIVTVSLLAMMFIFAWWVVTQALSDVAASALSVDREAPPINREVRNLNRLTKSILMSAEEFTPFTPRLLEITAALPPDIKLVGISIDRGAKSFDLSGTATTREALLNYEKVIDGINWIKGVTVPTSQLLQKENINFQIHGTLQNFPILTTNN